ncbi:hypothetical protein D3C75_522080 [compost metagenome]
MSSRRIIVKNWYAVSKLNGSFVLADVKHDKDTGAVSYPTVAIYSSELKLISDLINLMVKRAVYLKRVNNTRELLKEINHCGELCQTVMNKINNSEN